MLLFVHPSLQSKVKESLNNLIHVPFQFEKSGSEIIFFDVEKDYSVEDNVRSSQSVATFEELAF